MPIVRLPSLEDLCIFDIKFLLSSRLLSCWLFLTLWPRSLNFPIFNAGNALPDSSSCSTTAQCCEAPFVGMCCLHCSWTSVSCLVPILYFEPCNCPALEITGYSPQNAWSQLAKFMQTPWFVVNQSSIIIQPLWRTAEVSPLWADAWLLWISELLSKSANSAFTLRVDAEWRMPIYLCHIWRPCRLYKPPSGCSAC